MSYDRNGFWPSFSAPHSPDKILEIKIKRTVVPFTVIEVGDKDAWIRFKQSMAAKEEIAAKSRAERYARAVALIKSWVEEQNAPEDTRSCECGAGACGHSGHSSWCPMFELIFERGKTSQTSY
jgi:hypothetical protein